MESGGILKVYMVKASWFKLIKFTERRLPFDYVGIILNVGKGL